MSGGHLSYNWYAVQLLQGWSLFCARHGQLIAHSHSFEDYQMVCQISTTMHKYYGKNQFVLYTSTKS